MKFINLLSAFIFRDIKTSLSYKFAAPLKLVTIFLHLAVFYFIARLIPEGKSDTGIYGGYFQFVAIGLAFSQAFNSAMSACSEALRQEQLCSTLDCLFTS